MAGDLTRAVIYLTNQLNLNGEPAHDKRHILIKDPLAGLAFCLEDDLQGAKTLALIPGLTHDLGRLSEPNIDKIKPEQYGELEPYKNEDHARLSFLAVSKVSDLFPDLPKSLRDHLLYAVLQHQKGNDPDTGKFFLYFTQRCDREQIPGPDGILRMVAEDATQTRYGSLPLKQIEDDRLKHDLNTPYKEGATLPTHMEFFVRNLHQSAGSKADEKADELKAVTAKFLYIIASTEIREQIFAPEIARDKGYKITNTTDENDLTPEKLALADGNNEFITGKFKKVLTPEFWNKVKEPLDSEINDRIQFLVDNKSEIDLVKLLCHAPGATHLDRQPPQGEKTRLQIIEEKLSDLDEAGRERFKRGFAYAYIMREEFDNRDETTLNSALIRYPSTNSVPNIIAESILKTLINC